MGEYVNPLWKNFAPQHRVENLLLVEQNKVNYRDIRSKPYITVSAKGIANGLSDISNDGADFGPDTPNTQTSGIQEALNYVGTNGGGVVKLKSGIFNVFNILYLQYDNTKIVGENMASTTIHLAYPFNALGSGGFQNSNPIVTTDPTGTAQPEYTGIENVTIDASEAGNAEAGISIIMFRWGSHLTFKNIKIIGLNGTSTTPNGLNGNADFVDIENYITQSSDYVIAGTEPTTLVLAGGSNIHVSNVYTDGYWEFDGSPTPNSTYEDIVINGNNLLLDGSGTGSWGYTVFRNVKVFNGTNRAVNGNLQTNEGCYFVNCYFEGVVSAAARHTYLCEFNGGVGSIMDFRYNRVNMNGTALYNNGIGLPVGISAYEDSNGKYVAYIIGNIFINLTANNTQGGAGFIFGGFNATTDTDNLLILSNNIFPTSFSGLFGYYPQAASLILLIENNTGPFLTTMQNTGATPVQITALPGSIIKNNSFLIPSYPFSTNSTSTPPIPSSGTAQQNTNPYPVKVYVNGGAITEIQITINGTAYTVYSNSTASAVYEGFTLPAGASITLTYSTAPTWSWLPD